MSPNTGAISSDAQPLSGMGQGAIALGLGIIVVTACWLSTGASLGLFFGPMLLLPLAVAPLCVGVKPVQAVVISALLTLPVALAWLVGLQETGISLQAWPACVLLLISLVVATGLIARATRSVFLATTLTLAWLTWPVWLSPALSNGRGERAVGWLTSAHPLLAINGLLQPLGIWSQQSIAYRLTSLGQDVEYALPGAKWAIVVHLLLAAGIGLIGSVFAVNGARPYNPSPPNVAKKSA